MGKKINKPQFQIRQPKIPADKRGLHFSFRYLQQDHAKFPIHACPASFFVALFKEIKRYQVLSINSFKENSHTDHRHPITWSETTEISGFPHIDPMDDEIWTDDVWQFALPCERRSDSGRGWRVHGFIEKVFFYVVWLDPEHKLDKHS